MIRAISAKPHSANFTPSTIDMAFPHLIENTTGIAELSALVDWARHHRDSLKTTLAKDGVLLFRGFPVNTAEDFDAFAAAFGYGEFTYQQSLSNAVRINLTPRVFTANEAPPEVEIYLHHEMAQTPIYPQKIFFCCLSAADEGGATPVCLSDKLYATFKGEHPNWASKFENLGLKYTTHMPGSDDANSGQGRSWRSTLSVETAEEAEVRLAELGYAWVWHDDGSLSATTPNLPAVRQLADGSESFFNQVIAAYLGWKRSDDSTGSVVTFGNGEEIAGEITDALVGLSRRFTQPVDWQDGDVALVDNYRVMHGRYPYSGARKRQVVVCLARHD
jgi:hypothetical protein